MDVPNRERVTQTSRQGGCGVGDEDEFSVTHFHRFIDIDFFILSQPSDSARSSL